MPLPLMVLPSSTPADALRLALIGSLYHAHRPELADLAASADLELESPGIWLRPQDASLSAAWLEEKLLAAAVAAGLPLAWVHVVGRGREAAL